jgi:hypothetical protein
MPSYIPTSPDETNYSITTTLDGTVYLLTFKYSERESCYYLDLALADGTLLVAGKKVVCAVSLFRRQRYNPLVPQGALYVTPGGGVGQDDGPPDIGELAQGRRCALFYATAAELAT